MQTHVCRLKLDAAGEHLSIVRVAICVAYLKPIVPGATQREQPELLFTWLIILTYDYYILPKLDKTAPTISEIQQSSGINHPIIHLTENILLIHGLRSLQIFSIIAEG